MTSTPNYPHPAPTLALCDRSADMLCEELDTLHHIKSTVKHTPYLTKHSEPANYDISFKESITMRLRYLYDMRRYHRKRALYYYRLTTMLPAPSPLALSMYQEKYLYHERRTNKITTSIQYTKARTMPNKQPDFDLPTLKAIPIENFVEITSSGTFSIREERTPSCHYYENTNRWHDFGTDEGGDVIDLVMKLHTLNFIEACKYLSNI